MTFIDRLERRVGALAFPGILRYYSLLHALVFGLLWIRPELAEVLQFDTGKILQGEVWRVITGFFAYSIFGKPSIISLLFFFFAVQFCFMMSDGLEQAWGAFRTSLFCYSGMLLVLLGNFIFPSSAGIGGLALYFSAFFAYATLYPRTELHLFLVIPVQIRIIALVLGGLMVLQALGNPVLLLYAPFALGNFLLFAAWPAWRSYKQSDRTHFSENISRKHAEVPETSFHRCEVCGRTELTDRHLEFRIAADGKEYCEDHLPQ